MKLNPDCVRDILLTVEEKCDFSHGITLPSPHCQRLDKYETAELLYHLRQCNLAGFFYKASEDMLCNFTIKDLSPKGHEFLANIRKDSVWGKVKATAASIGSASLSALTQIAVNVISDLITAQFQP